ncbi:hypothetical protein HOLleu_09694 [Holothuria leucospilota]|uniref:Uncharacterized protein n=1 Tax=Holothuria leucospilota TaxID=206669 RepID=A0A9Q1CD66_HOLLE|nr:hypothetical protein HOLleu_09694 [Holothuria leucospilota]
MVFIICSRSTTIVNKIPQHVINCNGEEEIISSTVMGLNNLLLGIVLMHCTMLHHFGGKTGKHPACAT